MMKRIIMQRKIEFTEERMWDPLEVPEMKETALEMDSVRSSGRPSRGQMEKPREVSTFIKDGKIRDAETGPPTGAA